MREPNDVTRMAGFAFGISAVLAVATLLCVWPVLAHIKDHPELDAWMNELQSKGGYPCCSQADGSAVADVDWDTAVVNGENRYRVRISGVWIVVTPQEVVEGPNRFGPAVAWIYRDSVGVPNVRCFMPGAGI